jgi:GDP-D-mannose 3',5'-epimerase
MEKCLVTGGAGFIGHHLINYLRAKGHDTIGVDIKPPVNEPLDVIKGDLKNPTVCRKLSKGRDWVFNLAALNGSIEFTTNNRAELVHNNALVNLNMAQACYKNKVKRVFYASSACVYPMCLQNNNGVHALTETDDMPAEPDTEYGWEKLFSEHVYNSYALDYGLDVRIARFINIYGPETVFDTLFSKAPMALTKKVIDAGDGGDVHIWGDGGQKRTFCYITDLLDAIYLLMQSDEKRPVNIGSDELYSINQLVDLIALIEGVKVNKVPQLDKVQGVRVRQADLSRMYALGWKRKVDMYAGLSNINKYYKDKTYGFQKVS